MRNRVKRHFVSTTPDGRTLVSTKPEPYNLLPEYLRRAERPGEAAASSGAGAEGASVGLPVGGHAESTPSAPPPPTTYVYSDSAEERAKLRLDRRSPCGMCCQVFNNDCLPYLITNKAILEQRTMWGVTQIVGSHLIPSNLYAQVRICVFCAQFFSMERVATVEEEIAPTSECRYLRKNMAARVREHRKKYFAEVKKREERKRLEGMTEEELEDLRKEEVSSKRLSRPVIEFMSHDLVSKPADGNDASLTRSPDGGVSVLSPLDQPLSASTSYLQSTDGGSPSNVDFLNSTQSTGGANTPSKPPLPPRASLRRQTFVMLDEHSDDDAEDKKVSAGRGASFLAKPTANKTSAPPAAIKKSNQRAITTTSKSRFPQGAASAITVNSDDFLRRYQSDENRIRDNERLERIHAKTLTGNYLDDDDDEVTERKKRRKHRNANNNSSRHVDAKASVDSSEDIAWKPDPRPAPSLSSVLSHTKERMKIGQKIMLKARADREASKPNIPPAKLSLLKLRRTDYSSSTAGGSGTIISSATTKDSASSIALGSRLSSSISRASTPSSRRRTTTS